MLTYLAKEPHRLLYQPSSFLTDCQLNNTHYCISQASTGSTPQTLLPHFVKYSQTKLFYTEQHSYIYMHPVLLREVKQEVLLHPAAFLT